MDEFCAATDNGVNCTFMKPWEPANPPSADTRSYFQLAQVALEKRFQAWSEDYDTPEGRETELADITNFVMVINLIQSPHRVEIWYYRNLYICPIRKFF